MVAGMFIAAGSNFFGSSLVNIQSDDEYAKKIYQGASPLSQNIKDSVPIPLNIDETASFFLKYIKEDKISELCASFNIPAHCRQDFYLFCKACSMLFEEYINDTENAKISYLPTIYENLITNPTLQHNTKIEVTDAHYLLEFKKCPLCPQPLTKVFSGKRYRNYEIVQIYPSNLSTDKIIEFNNIEDRSSMNLESENNNIALCTTCAHIYKMTQDPNTYQRLLIEKKGALKEAQIQECLGGKDMEKNITKVIDGLISIRDRSKLTQLNLSALKLSEKLDGVPTITYTSIEDKVLRYYNFIDSYFQQKEFMFEDGASIIGSEIKLMSHSLVQLGLSKIDVIETIKNEINNRIHGNAETLEACGIIVAYFIQHCEVLTI